MEIGISNLSETTLVIERATQLGRRWTVSAQSRSPVKLNYKVIELWIYMSNVSDVELKRFPEI